MRWPGAAERTRRCRWSPEELRCSAKVANCGLGPACIERELVVMGDKFTAFDVRITRGRRRGQLARVLGSMNTNDGRRLTCKFPDGAYEMISERNTQPLRIERP